MLVARDTGAGGAGGPCTAENPSGCPPPAFSTAVLTDPDGEPIGDTGLVARPTGNTPSFVTLRLTMSRTPAVTYRLDYDVGTAKRGEDFRPTALRVIQDIQDGKSRDDVEPLKDANGNFITDRFIVPASQTETILEVTLQLLPAGENADGDLVRVHLIPAGTQVASGQSVRIGYDESTGIISFSFILAPNGTGTPYGDTLDHYLDSSLSVPSVTTKGGTTQDAAPPYTLTTGAGTKDEDAQAATLKLAVRYFAKGADDEVGTDDDGDALAFPTRFPSELPMTLRFEDGAGVDLGGSDTYTVSGADASAQPGESGAWQVILKRESDGMLYSAEVRVSAKDVQGVAGEETRAVLVAAPILWDADGEADTPDTEDIPRSAANGGSVSVDLAFERKGVAGETAPTQVSFGEKSTTPGFDTIAEGAAAACPVRYQLLSRS